MDLPVKQRAAAAVLIISEGTESGAEMGGSGPSSQGIAGGSSVQPGHWSSITLVVAAIRFSRVCSTFLWLVFAISGHRLLKSLVSRLCLGEDLV